MQITIIRHHHNQLELDDNAVKHLEHCGHELVHRYPFDGDKLTLPKSGAPPTIVLGGGQNVTEVQQHRYLQDELKWIHSCVKTNTPLLGICLGAQLVAHALGAKVVQRKPKECEYGFYQVFPTQYSGSWLSQSQYFMQAHYQEFTLPDGAVPLAYSNRFQQQAFSYGESTFAMQFHPEVNKPIFLDWLADSWSDEMAAMPGAQSKAEQLACADQYLDAQASWFANKLSALFGDAKK